MQDTIRVEDGERLAYTKAQAARLLSIGRTSLWQLERAGEITPLPNGRFARSELHRWTEEQLQLARRKAEQARKPKRVPRSQYKPINQPLPCQP